MAISTLASGTALQHLLNASGIGAGGGENVYIPVEIVHGKMQGDSVSGAMTENNLVHGSIADDVLPGRILDDQEVQGIIEINEIQWQ